MKNQQNVFITGSSSGFGSLITHTLLENGYTVFATMRNSTGKNAAKAQALQVFARDKSSTLHILDLDVNDEVSVETAVQQALDRAGHIDIVINNAGFGIAGYAEGTTIEQLHQIFDTNVYGVQRVNRAVLPSMRKRGSGLLLHISSAMGRIVLPFAAPYTASKYALEGLAESYRYELASTGIDVAIVEPGGFPTSFFDKMAPVADAARVATYGALQNAPEQMWGSVAQILQSDDAPDPQTVADAVLNLIETPAGKRPLRVVVDPMTGGEGATAVNTMSSDVQTQLLTAFGLGNLLSVN